MSILESGGVKMRIIKHNKNLITYIIIALYTFMMNLSIFYFSEVFINFNNFNINSVNSLANIPKSFHIELLSINGILPEEATLTVSEYVKLHFRNYERSPFNSTYSTLPALFRVKMFVYKLMATYNSTQNTTTSNAIPLGGHAPPFLSINS